VKETKKFAIGGYTPKPVAQPMPNNPTPNVRGAVGKPIGAVGQKPVGSPIPANLAGPSSTRTDTPSKPIATVGIPSTTMPRPIATVGIPSTTMPRRTPIPVLGAKPTAPTNNVGIGKFMQDQFNKPRSMGEGGAVKAKRGDGIAQRGKTRCRMV